MIQSLGTRWMSRVHLHGQRDMNGSTVDLSIRMPGNSMNC